MLTKYNKTTTTKFYNNYFFKKPLKNIKQFVSKCDFFYKKEYKLNFIIFVFF